MTPAGSAPPGLSGPAGFACRGLLVLAHHDPPNPPVVANLERMSSASAPESIGYRPAAICPLSSSGENADILVEPIVLHTGFWVDPIPGLDIRTLVFRLFTLC